MFLKLYINLIPNNLGDVTESPIWNTLIPSRLELSYDIDDYDDMKMKEKKKKKVTMMMMMMSYHQCQSKATKLITCVDFKPFNFLVQQHENTKQTESNTTHYVVWFDLNELLSDLEWLCMSHNFLASRSWEKMRSLEKLASYKTK